MISILDVIAKHNPFNRVASSRQRDLREAELRRKEARVVRLENAVTAKKNHIQETATKLEATVNEALERYDRFRKEH